jgi:hypothetical protein
MEAELVADPALDGEPVPVEETVALSEEEGRAD